MINYNGKYHTVQEQSLKVVYIIIIVALFLSRFADGLLYVVVNVALKKVRRSLSIYFLVVPPAGLPPRISQMVIEKLKIPPKQPRTVR